MMVRDGKSSASRRAGRLWRGLLVLALASLISWVMIPAEGSTTHRPPRSREGPGGQNDPITTILARVVGTQDQDAYELTADFKASLTVFVKGAPFTAEAEGTYKEVRKPGEPRRRKIKIHRVDLPLLLRPFTGSVQSSIENKVDLKADNPETYRGHDIFILEDQGDGRYVLAGIHRDIVDEAIDRYGQPDQKTDPAIRRNVSRWLYSSPTMRTWIVRSGPPYAVRTVVDEDGLVYDLGLFYDWGQVGTKISYVVIGGQSVWREIVTDTVSELASLGRVDGKLTLTFSNHCLNCRP